MIPVDVVGKARSRIGRPSRRNPIETPIESLQANRLRQVIQRVHFECLDGIFVECRHEYNRRLGWNEEVYHIKTIEYRHLHVNEDDVRL